MNFINEIQNEIRNNPKSYGGVSENDFTTKTGFTCLDYLNGQIITKDSGEKQLYTGISNGRIIQIIGKSGSGKSTLGMQIAGNILSRYKENGLCYLYDFEQNNTVDRFRMVTGLSEAFCDEHFVILRDNITTEAVLRSLSKVKEAKLKHKEELLVDNENGLVDEDGKVIKVMTPTVFIVDSLALMMPSDNIETEEIQGSMAATSIAKVNSQFFKKAGQICQAGNIILIFINHITQQISIGATPVAAQVNYLKQDEAISGGKTAMYMTDTLIKITTGSKLEPDKTYGIKGFEAKIEICKSRRAPAGRYITAIYDQVNGFREELTMLEYIKACNGLGGNGMAYYLKDSPSQTPTKFKLSNFVEKYNSIPEFKEEIKAICETYLKDSIKISNNFAEVVTAEEAEVGEITNEQQQ